MRNLKKILALVLALVMSFSLMATANAFTDDKDIDATYDEAVTVLSNLKVFQGYDNGSFLPKGDITRAEVAAIIYRIVTGDVTDAQVSIYADYNKFNDVKSTSWYAGYVNYCANAGYIKGYDAKTFGPNDKVTGYQALAMILRAIGYDVNDEFTGSGWQVKVASTANQLGVTRNVTAGTLGGAASREVVAEILFRTIAEAYIVEYTTAFGYQPVYLATSTNNGGSDNNLFGRFAAATLGFQTFGLQMTEGEITAVGRTAGTTTLLDESIAENGTTLNSVIVTNTDTPWTDIGYAAYVYTVPTTGTKTREAVSDVIITGESLLVSTDGTSHAALAVNNTKKVELEDTFHVYYNGELTSAATTPTTTAALARVDDRGVKVDYIDNDNGGLVETIVVTEYTPAVVTGIATATSTSGSNATAASTVYFTGVNGDTEVTVPVKDANVVADQELALQDIVTYVVYRNDYYTTVAPLTSNVKFTAVGRDRWENQTELYYVIGDENLYKSGLAIAAWVAYLKADNTNSMVSYCVDPYGYIIYADEYTPATVYALGLSNNHTVGNTKLSDAYVINTDGSVSNISVASMKSAGVTYTDLANNVITKNLYTYTVNSDGSYALVAAGTPITSVTYKSGASNIALNSTTNNYYVDSKTIVVDVTDVLSGKADTATVYTGHVGDSKIPSMGAADGWFVTDGNYVSLMFVWDVATKTSDHFMVYTIDENIVTKSGTTVTIDVIRDGKYDTVTLSATEYDKIVGSNTGHGVGIYDTATGTDGKTLITSYTSFSEAWNRLAWANNSVVEYNKATNTYKTSYKYTDDTTFTVINVTNDSYETFDMVYGQNYLWMTGSQSLGFVEATNGVADHIYVIVGAEATKTAYDKDNEKNGYLWMVNEDHDDGSTTTYYVGDDVVTTVETTAADPAKTDNLYSVKVKGVEAEATGGKGTKAEPFTYVAGLTQAQMDDTTNEKWIVVEADNRNASVKITYADGVTNLKEGIGSAEDDQKDKVSTSHEWLVVCDGVYYDVKVKLVKTAAELLNEATAGGTIKLPAGEYTLPTIDKNITIDGSDGAVITGKIEVANNVDSVTIKNCTIKVDDVSNYISFGGTRTNALRVEISGNTFIAEKDDTNSAIYIDATANCKFEVTGNTFIGDFEEGAVNIDMMYGSSTVIVTGNDFSQVTGAHIHIWNVKWQNLTTDVANTNIVTKTNP